MFCLTSLMSAAFRSSLPFFNLLVMCWFCRFTLISSIRFMALTVLVQVSRSYFTGTCRFFSNSNDGSTARSLPAAFRNAFVHLAFLGLRFFLNALWHLDRQNLKILQSLR